MSQSNPTSSQPPTPTPPTSNGTPIVTPKQLVAGALGWLQSTASSISHMVHEAVREDERIQPDRPDTNAIDAMQSAEHQPRLSYALTPTLLEFAMALSEHESTFLHFPRGHQQFALTPAQEDHARLLLAQCAPLGQLRFRLVPKKLSESEFWRIYFLLMRNVARKVAAREESIPEEPNIESVASSSPPAAAASTVSPAKSSSVTASSSPYRSSLDFDEIDRLCGLNSHGRRVSASFSDDEDDIEDQASRDVIDEIVRRHRTSGSFSVTPAEPTHKTQSSLDATAEGLNTSSTELGVSEAELDAALAEESNEPASNTVKLNTVEELP